MGVEGGNIAVPITPKADNAEMKVEKTPYLSHSQRLYTALFPLSDGMEIQIKICYPCFYIKLNFNYLKHSFSRTKRSNNTN